MSKCKCWYCGGALEWKGNYNYDEIYGCGEGYVTLLECSQCNANVQYTFYDEEQSDTDE